MPFIFRKKFLVTNVALFVFVKFVFSFSGSGLLGLISGDEIFTQRDILEATNNLRKSLDLQPLTENVALNVAAAQKLEDMLINQYFAHFSPDGTSPWHWFEINRYQYSYAGENLAMGFQDAQTTVAAWAQSPSHRRNMVSPNYRDIGVAVKYGKINDVDGAIVVQLFGAPATVTSQTEVSLSQSSARSPVSIGVSQGSAQESTPAPKPTPASGITSSPFPATGIATEQKPSTVPVRNQIVSRTTRLLDQTLVIYFLLAALLSVGYVIFREFKRQLILRAALTVILLLLAAWLPVLEPAASIGIIF